jgi:CTP synthase
MQDQSESRFEDGHDSIDTNYLFVTGGVMSGLGKGITAASVGRLLINAGVDVTAIKIDPYINVDAGTMNPLEHGEVYVLNDGSEVDLDLGNYERFLNVDMSGENNITTGTVYQDVIDKERDGEYLGETVQIIPHITDEIQSRLQEVPSHDEDVCIVELGGTIGDIEGMPFTEAVRQFMQKYPDNTALCHVTLVPYTTDGEQKTKPTQHSVKELRSIGLEPDMVVGRCDDELAEKTKQKIAQFCDVPLSTVFSNPDVGDIYRVPQVLQKESIRECVIELLELEDSTIDENEWGSDWREKVSREQDESRSASIAIVGKYDLDDAYLSIFEALKHSGYELRADVSSEFVDSEQFEESDGTVNMSLVEDVLTEYDGVIVPGGFGKRGTEGKITAIQYSRENDVPFLGICFGMQLAVVEYARNVCGLTDVHSAEINEGTTHPVIDILPEQHTVEEMGGTMRLGGQKSMITQGTIAAELYGDFCIERHRHRYEVNPEYIDVLENNGLVFSGTKNNRMETIELPQSVHPFFFGTQFHPEFTSRPNDPNPAFIELVSTILQQEF